MKIGGHDLIYGCTLDAENARDEVCRLIRLTWPYAIVESDKDAGCPDDRFIFRDADSRTAWQRLGGSPENLPTMIHFLWDKGIKQMTLVVGDKEHPQVRRIVDAIESLRVLGQIAPPFARRDPEGEMSHDRV